MSLQNSVTNYGTEIRWQIYRLLFKSSCPLESNSSYNSREKTIVERWRDEDKKLEEHEGRMYPAILQTNRTIYAEASLLLYRNMTVNMCSCDVIWLSDIPTTHRIKFGKPKLWRHDPLLGMGYRNAEGV